MTDSQTEDARLDKTEAQMRRALGLTGNTPVRSTPHQSTIGGNGSHPQRRQFARDGDVPVTIVRHHHPDNESTNQLDAARQAIRTQTAARERAERLLEEAHQTIRQLQTTVVHERLAHDEAIERASAEGKTAEKALETVRTELAGEKNLGRERAEQALRDARVAITNLIEKLHLAKEADRRMQAEWEAERQKAVEAARATIADAPANGNGALQTVRGPRGRQRKQIVVETVEKAVKKPREKAIKWWLGDR